MTSDQGNDWLAVAARLLLALKSSRKLLLILSAFICAAFLAVWLDLFDRFYLLTRKYEHLQVDELVLAVLLVAGIAVVWRAVAKKASLQNQLAAVLSAQTGDGSGKEAIIDHLYEGLAVIQDQRISYANRALLRISGYSEKEIYSRSFIDFVHPQDREVVSQLVEEIRQGLLEAKGREVRFILADGTVRWGEARITPCQWYGAPAFLATVRDIDQRKRLEQELRQSGLRLQTMVADRTAELTAAHEEKAAVLDAISDAVIYYDPDLRVRWANLATAEQLGREPGQLPGRTCHELWQCAEGSCTGCPVMKTMTSRQLAWGRQSNPDGRQWFMRSSPVFSDLDDLVGVVTTARDITEQQRAEAALIESEETARALLNASGDAAALLDPGGKILTANENFAQSWGHNPREMAGREMNRHLPPDLAARRQSFFNIALRVGLPVYLEDSSNGRDLANTFYPVFGPGGKVERVAFFSRDISEQKKTSRALKESEEKFAKAFRASPAGVSVTTLHHGRYIDVNDTFERITGFSRQEAVGRSAQDLGLWADQRQRSRYLRLLENKGSFQDEEIMLRNRQGRPIWVLWSAELIELQGETCVVSVLLDITVRKKAQEKLSKQARELHSLNRLSQQIGAELDLKGVAQGTVSQVMEVLDPDLVRLFIRQGDLLEPMAGLTKGAKPLNGKEDPHRVDRCLCGLAVNNGEAVYSLDIDKDPRCTLDDCKNRGMKSLAALPIKSGEQVIGVLVLAAAEQRDFGRQKEFLETICHQVGIGLNNAMLYQRVRQHSLDLQKHLEELTRAEEALRLSQERYTLATRAALVGVWDWDLAAGTYYLDPNIKGLLGYQDREIPNDLETWLGHMHPQDRNAFMQAFHDHFAAGQEQFVSEVRMLHRDGSTRWILARGDAIRDEKGQVTRIVGTDTDITERKLAEDELQVSREQFSKAFMASPAWVSISTLGEGRILEANEAFLKGTGYQRGEMVDHTASELGLWPDPSDYSLAMDMLRNQGSLRNYQALVRSKSGRRLLVEWSAEPIELAGRRCLISMMMDITARKQAEVALLQYQERLRRLASRLSLTEERERRKVATDLHDLIGQNLALGVMYLKAIKDRSIDGDYHDSLARVVLLLEQALSDSQEVIRYLSPPELYELGLGAALKRLAEHFLRQHDLKVAFNSRLSLRNLPADTLALLYRGASELLINVVKHAGVTAAKLELQRLDGAVQIVVSDQGVGYDQQSGGHSQDNRGGFGLFSLRERLLGIGGKLDMYSQPGQGTRAEITVPLRPAAGSLGEEYHEH